MNISGIRTYAGFYDYNTIKQSKMRSRQIQKAKAANEQELLVPTEVPVAGEERCASVADNVAKDFGGQYEPDVVYDKKGADCDIFKLDMEKMIADLKKDEVLLEYQFFVNSAAELGNLAGNDAEQFVL